MPTINSMVNQINMTARLSTQFFGHDFTAANKSVLVGGTFNTLNNMFQSEFGGQPALNNIVESYRERRENFQDDLRDNMNSLRDSAKKLNDATNTETAAANATNNANADTNATANATNSATTRTAATTATAANNANANVATAPATANTAAAGNNLSRLMEFARGNIPPDDDEPAIIAVEANDENQPEEVAEADSNTAATGANNLNEFAQNYLTADETEEAEDINEATAVANDANEDRRLNSVRNLINDYNNTVDYLRENRSISNNMASIARNLRNDKELTESLRNIGVTINARGELNVDEERLAQALEEDPDNVNSVLGSEGLTGRLERDIDKANAQNDRLFTNVYDFARSRQQDYAQSLYISQVMNIANYAWENTARLMTMLT